MTQEDHHTTTALAVKAADFVAMATENEVLQVEGGRYTERPVEGAAALPHTCLHCRLITGSVRLTRKVCTLWPVATCHMAMVCGKTVSCNYMQCGGQRRTLLPSSKCIPCPLRQCRQVWHLNPGLLRRLLPCAPAAGAGSGSGGCSTG